MVISKELRINNKFNAMYNGFTSTVFNPGTPSLCWKVHALTLVLFHRPYFAIKSENSHDKNFFQEHYEPQRSGS